MRKLYGWILCVIMIGSLIVAISADPSIEIKPDVLYQDMPVVIDYTGFTNGEQITAEYEFTYTAVSNDPSGLTDGFLLYPFKLNDGNIQALSGDLAMNEKPVPTGTYNGLETGLVSVQVTRPDIAPGNDGTVAFQVSGDKVSGEDSGSMNFIPVFTPEQGVLNVSVSIGNTLISRQIICSNEIPKAGSISTTEEPAIRYPQYGIMKQTPEQLQDEMKNNLAVPVIPDATLPVDQGSKNLLSNVPYTPSERNQGNCGNCWVWASTGVIETAHTVQNSIFDRLSIQYLNSNLNGGTGSNWACEGGSPSGFVSFYNTAEFKKGIPWSNTNASYADANACPGGDCSAGTKMPAGYISQNPNYPLSSISTAQVSTQTVNQAQAIANIKAQLNADKALYYGFRLPTDSAWNGFSAFWNSQPETVIWDPDPYNVPSTDAGGHGVLLVGYDDTSANPDEWYWIVLNSWGSSANRPNGLFRLKMNMDYAGMGIYYNHYFYRIDVSYTETPTPTPTPVTPTPTPTPSVTYTLDVQSDGLGWISPSGVFTVPNGSSQNLTFRPTAGAVFKNLTVNGNVVSVNPGYTYMLQNIVENKIVRLNNQLIPNLVIAAFNAGFTPGSLSVQFNDTSYADVVPNKWKWNFGDGTQSEERNVTHLYTAPGTYTVTLWARNDVSQSQEIQGKIVVPFTGEGINTLNF